MNAALSPDAARTLLMDCLDAAIDAAMPARSLAAHLPARPQGRCIVVGGGKASAAMAAAVEAAWPDVPMTGLVITRYGHAVPTQHVRIIEAAHPVPDAAGLDATQRMLDLVATAVPGDLVLALVSGGGSALLTAPAEGLTLADKQEMNRLLLAAGAPIGLMNRVRPALSRIKGGGLARAVPPGVTLVTLVISDVPGDDLAIIASGPTITTATSTRAEAAAILARFGIEPPPAVAALLAMPERATLAAHQIGEVRLIASPMMALHAARTRAAAHGINVMILGDALEGESREVATVMAGIARSVAENGHPATAPLLLLSGGETSVTMPRAGNVAGGRNTEFCLALALAAEDWAGRTGALWALAADTDGIDGNQDAAGALIDPGSLTRARALGLDPRALLDRHESYRLFDGIGGLIRTGPTNTNVNDFRAVLVMGPDTA